MKFKLGSLILALMLLFTGCQPINTSQDATTTETSTTEATTTEAPTTVAPTTEPQLLRFLLLRLRQFRT